MSKKSTPIPGLSISLKRALGISQIKQKIARDRHSDLEGWSGTQNWQLDNKYVVWEEI